MRDSLFVGSASKRLLGIAAVVLCGLLVAAAYGATIRGTARNDTLRGTPRADRIYGLAGKDTLYGLAGSDVLVGGAGIDRFFCGAGRDTALAERGELVASDCEVVRRAAPAPPPPPPPAPSPTPTPTPTPQAKAVSGPYCGFTGTGGGLCFTVGEPLTGPQHFTAAVLRETSDCQPEGRFRLTIRFTGRADLATDRSFRFEVLSGDLAGTVITGVFDTGGTGRGTLSVRVSFDSDGTRVTCSWDSTWEAKRQF